MNTLARVESFVLEQRRDAERELCQRLAEAITGDGFMRARMRLGITQGHLAARLQVSQTMVCRLEKGRQVPPDFLVRALGALLKPWPP